MMGGTVNVKSTIGQGTTFTLRVPKVVTAISSPDITAPSVPENEPLDQLDSIKNQLDNNDAKDTATELTAASYSECVLVIDDDEETCELLWKTLVSHGYFVVLTHNTHKGLKMAEQLMPDIILLDSTMPKKDGYDLLKVIEARPALTEVPIILQTKRTDHTLSYALETTTHLDKSISPENILEILNKKLSEPIDYPCHYSDRVGGIDKTKGLQQGVSIQSH